MNFIDLFNGDDDLTDTLIAVRDRILPLLDWLEAHEDPANRIKVQAALFILFTYRAVTEHGMDKEAAIRLMGVLVEAIESGDFDGPMTLQ